MSTASVSPMPGSTAADDLGRRQRVADIRVRPRLGEDDAADRAILEDERTAAVAAVDRRPQLEDLAADLGGAVDVVARRRIATGDGGGQDRQRTAAGVSERGAERPAVRVVGGERQRPGPEARDVEERDIELRVEDDGQGVEGPPARTDPDAAGVGTGDHVRVRHDVVARDREPGPDR